MLLCTPFPILICFLPLQVFPYYISPHSRLGKNSWFGAPAYNHTGQSGACCMCFSWTLSLSEYHLGQNGSGIIEHHSLTQGPSKYVQNESWGSACVNVKLQHQILVHTGIQYSLILMFMLASIFQNLVFLISACYIYQQIYFYLLFIFFSVFSNFECVIIQIKVL